MTLLIETPTPTPIVEAQKIQLTTLPQLINQLSNETECKPPCKNLPSPLGSIKKDVSLWLAQVLALG